MLINWESWQTLLAVARTGTLARAADALGIDATTAGRRVKRLEARLGRRLLERSGGVLVPTPACAAILPHLATAERALAEAQAATAGEASAAHARVVRITSVAVLCDHVLAPALPRLLAGRHLRVELIGGNRNLSLVRGEADVALRLGPPTGAGASARVVGTLCYAAYAAASADPDSLPWAGYDTTLAHLPEFRWTEAAAGRAGVAFRVNRTEAARSLVVAGLARRCSRVRRGRVIPDWCV